MLETASLAIVVVALPETQADINDGLAVGFYPQDCGAATQNILLQAVELGLGTCWCGVYPKENRIAEIREIFEIADTKIPFCVIAVGVPDENPEPRGQYDEGKVSYIN
jgi:nitroreductase